MVNRDTRRRPLRALSALPLAAHDQPAVRRVLGAAPAHATASRGASSSLWFDDAADSVLTVQNGHYVDGDGRDVVLRGFNVSGEFKLAENSGLPFASVADAHKSAAAMREPDRRRFRQVPDHVGLYRAGARQDPLHTWTDVIAQMQAFLDEGIDAFVDFHEDLYSRYIFNSGSWYTGDGAPDWVIADGGYPTENCGACVTWGQNLTSNAAVQDAMYDFWHTGP